MSQILFILILVICFFCCGQFYFVLRALKIDINKEPKDFDFTPPVSILKPLRDIDPELYENLFAFCQLDYPSYEIIFCFKDSSDPAFEIVNRLKKGNGNVSIKIVVDPKFYGFNPKVDNLVAGLNVCENDLILISDGDIRPHRSYLKEIVPFFKDPKVGLVNNLIKGDGNLSFGAIFENLHLNIFIIGTVCLTKYAFGHPVVIGKSMLLKKSDLEKIGGILAFKDYLAEDYLIGRKLQKMGKKVIISNRMITTINHSRPFPKFWNRHLRWAKIRSRLHVPAYFSELLLNPIFFSLIFLFTSSFSKNAFHLFLIVTIFKTVLDAVQGKMVNKKLSILTYLFVPLKDLLMVILWFTPFFRGTVTWRKQELRIKRHTELVSID